MSVQPFESIWNDIARIQRENSEALEEVLDSFEGKETISMVDKKTLQAWLKGESVSIVSADVDVLPGLPGETVTIILTNSKPEHQLKGANRLNVEEPEESEAEKQRKELDRKKVQEGWEE